MGRHASDDSEGKEVSDTREKCASDGSEGSEACESIGVRPYTEQIGVVPILDKPSPFDLFDMH